VPKEKSIPEPNFGKNFDRNTIEYFLKNDLLNGDLYNNIKEIENEYINNIIQFLEDKKLNSFMSLDTILLDTNHKLDTLFSKFLAEIKKIMK
jgi:hypothetical protein